MIDLNLLGKKAKAAAADLAGMPDDMINSVLTAAAAELKERAEYIKAQNALDVAAAKANGRSAQFIDRLTLTDNIINGMAEGLKQVAALESPLDKIIYSYENKEQGIFIEQKTVPFGVVGIIYEARPNVTADAFALCFKTRNSVILKGGSDALRSNVAVVEVLKKALTENGVTSDAVSVIEDTSRETAAAFMRMNRYVDLLIPRGSASLINAALENSTIPIIETGTGNCHIYVDEFADLNMAAEVIFNAKTQRYSTCNTCESLVIHSAVLDKALPGIAEKLKTKGVEIRCDERALNAIDCGVPATEEDFYTEYGAPVISVKTVDGIDEAIEHINEHSTKHSEAIITENQQNAEKFLEKIDSSAVYVNASTRFTDGFIFGLGAEIGISTQKLHARGPMGLKALVTTKYLIHGNGAVRK